MEYTGMPYSWVYYYEKAFKAVNNEFDLKLSEEDIRKSCEVMQSKNARVVYREIEYTPEEVFSAVTDHWKEKANIDDIIKSFYKGHELKPFIYWVFARHDHSFAQHPTTESDDIRPAFRIASDHGFA